MPPPAHWGARVVPWRARPVPFCRHGFAPPPETPARFFVACVPERRAASCRRTSAWKRWSFTGASKTPGERSTVPALRFSAVFTSSVAISPLRLSELDLDVHARRELELHQCVDGLRRGIQDVDQPFVRAHLELLARLLVDVRPAQHGVAVD